MSYHWGHSRNVAVQSPAEEHQEVSILPGRFLHPIRILFIAHIHQNDLYNFLHFRNKVAPFSLNRMASTLEENKDEQLTIYTVEKNRLLQGY